MLKFFPDGFSLFTLRVQLWKVENCFKNVFSQIVRVWILFDDLSELLLLLNNFSDLLDKNSIRLIDLLQVRVIGKLRVSCLNSSTIGKNFINFPAELMSSIVHSFQKILQLLSFNSKIIHIWVSLVLLPFSSLNILSLQGFNILHILSFLFCPQPYLLVVLYFRLGELLLQISQIVKSIV